MSTPGLTSTTAKALQDCAVAWLASGAEFSGVPILGRRKSNIQNDIDQAVNELGGACIYVLPGLPTKFKYTSAPYADRYELRIRAIENPALNQTKPDVYELVDLIIRRIYGLEFDTITGMAPLMLPEGGGVVEVADAGGERLIQDVIFETSLGLLPRVEN